VTDEIFDMANPRDRRFITLADLKACGVGHTIVSMLTDVQGFFEYDNREALMQQYSMHDDGHAA
jgi:serine/threonine-protein phosphatase 2A regulatory subunit B''